MPDAVTGGIVLRIRLRFHKYTPQQLTIGWALHQQAAHQLGGDLLSGASEEELGEVRGEGGGRGSGLTICIDYL